MIFEARGLSVRYPGQDQHALADVSLTVDTGSLVAIVGPNGSGKTTLLRTLLGQIPCDGQVVILGRSLTAWHPRDLAREIGVVAQREEMVFPIRVAETVMLGRYAQLGPLQGERAADHAAVRYALERCDVWAFRRRFVETLSGGEWQRVRVARALAQEPRALVLDEPTASLDVRHEMELFELVRGLVDGGLGCLLITHHLNLAARYADRMLLLDRGRVAAAGTPERVLQASIVQKVFGWPVETRPWRPGVPQVVPLRPDEVQPPR